MLSIITSLTNLYYVDFYGNSMSRRDDVSLMLQREPTKNSHCDDV